HPDALLAGGPLGLVGAIQRGGHRRRQLMVQYPGFRFGDDPAYKRGYDPAQRILPPAQAVTGQPLSVEGRKAPDPLWRYAATFVDPAGTSVLGVGATCLPGSGKVHQ